jgi:hypothetical protein
VSGNRPPLDSSLDFIVGASANGHIVPALDNMHDNC